MLRPRASCILPVLGCLLLAGTALAGRRPLSTSLKRKLRLAAAQERSVSLLVRFRDHGAGAAAPAMTGQSWEQLSPEARTDLRRRTASLVARRVLGPRAPQAEALWVSNTVLLELDAAEALDLAENPDVEAVFEDRRFQMLPPSPAASDTAPSAPAGVVHAPGGARWGLDAMGAARIQKELGLDGEGVVLGHIDTGAEASHPHLKGRVKGFRDFVEDRDLPYDDHGHGTHTLGVMVGGGAGRSVAPKARVLVGRALDETGGGQLSDLVRALQWMADPDGNPDTRDQPFALNCSWGLPRAELKAAGVSDRIFWDAVQSLRDAGVVPVFSSGNEGPEVQVVPGGYPHVLSVGAHDARGAIPHFSSGGMISWGGESLLRPDLVAPGKGVYSSHKGGRYRTLQGTSQAAPHLTGLLALMKQAKPGLSASQAEAIVRRSVQDRGSQGPDPRAGRGSLDGWAAVQAVKGSAVRPPPRLKPPVLKPAPKPGPPAVRPRPPPPPRPAPAKERIRRTSRKAVVGAVTGIALALGLGLLLFR